MRHTVYPCALWLAMAPLAWAGEPCAAASAALDRALDTPHCATAALGAAIADTSEACLDRVLEQRGLGRRVASAPGPRTATKEARSPYGPVELVETDNFALWYGVLEGFTVTDVQQLGASLEHAWIQEVEVMGYPPPLGSEAAKLNVFIDGTDAGPPDTGPFTAGYFTHDPEGRPMIVIDRGQLGTPGAAGTAAHELFHACQDAIGAYTSNKGRWYWEATATWAQAEVYPDDPSYADNLPGFALRPDLHLGFFQSIGTGDLTEFHSYGAFLWPRYLTEVVDGPELVRESWLEAPVSTGVASAPVGDPLKVLAGLLGGSEAVDRAFGDFAIRNATWDYADEQLYEDVIAGWSRGRSTRPSGVLAVPSTWQYPTDDLPSSFGANYWSLRDVPASMLVSYEAFEQPRHTTLAVVGQFGGEHVRVSTELSGGQLGTLRVEGFDTADEVLLVVAIADGTDPGRGWPYAFRVEEVAPEEEDPRGCGCASGTTPGLAGLWALVVLLGQRRSGH